ncbi:hypothetical protein PRZ48_012785 [Zasmidium cellare]|uniref:DUF7730 domain-containing protein n=1 Tax=Zasmidium cellare TaxID=395010 RepID=A0ABR0E5V8_ZASCE|nr:hypothetical protein PRZ48_012785 [Zasmidium cellare]
MSAIDNDTDAAATAQRHQDDQLEARREAELQVLIESRLHLKHQIEDLVASHQHDRPPPFTSPELIIMAVVLSKTESCRERNIINWVRATFPYYDERVKDGEEHAASLGFDFDPIDDAMYSMAEDFFDAMSAWEVPMLQYGNYYSVKTEAAQISLRRWLEPERKGTFRFLDLPAELRNRIYQLVLVFPRSKITVRQPLSRRGAIDLYATERDTEYDAYYPEYRHLILKPNEILNIALVNRQLAKESLSIFYGENNFTFEGASAIDNFIKITPAQHMRLIKRIEISTPTYANLKAAFWKKRDVKMRSTVEALSDLILTLSSLTIMITYGNSTSDVTRAQLSELAMFEEYSSLQAVTKLVAKARKTTILFDYYGHNKEQAYIEAIQEPMLEKLRRLRGGAGVVTKGSQWDHRSWVIEFEGQGNEAEKKASDG